MTTTIERKIEAALLARTTKQNLNRVNKRLEQLLKSCGVWVERFREGPTDGLYLRTVPKVIPDGWRLVHNRVVPTRHLGNRGFRAWITNKRRGLKPCPCGFAPELGVHYRIGYTVTG